MSGLLFLLIAAVLVWLLTRNAGAGVKASAGRYPRTSLCSISRWNVVQRDMRDWIVESILEFSNPISNGVVLPPRW